MTEQAQDVFDSSDSVRSGSELPHAKSVTFDEPLKLTRGGQLPEVTVAFDGDAPEPEPLDLRTDAYCRKLKVTDPSVIVNDDDTLRNVVVRLQGVDGKYEPNPEHRVTIGQDKCLFVPRVQVAMRGEKMAVTNDDPTLHNVHAFKGPNDESWFNLVQPKSAPAIVKKLDIDDRTRVRCDIHPWMDAWVFVADHPFQGVSGQAGPVVLRDVPARGKPYHLVTWHERYGTKEATVRVEGGKTAKVTVRYSSTDERP